MIVPNETDQHNTERKKIMKKDELKLLKMSDIQVREVDWLWYPYIPFGSLTKKGFKNPQAQLYEKGIYPRQAHRMRYYSGRAFKGYVLLPRL